MNEQMDRQKDDMKWGEMTDYQQSCWEQGLETLALFPDTGHGKRNTSSKAHLAVPAGGI